MLETYFEFLKCINTSNLEEANDAVSQLELLIVLLRKHIKKLQFEDEVK